MHKRPCFPFPEISLGFGGGPPTGQIANQFENLDFHALGFWIIKRLGGHLSLYTRSGNINLKR